MHASKRFFYVLSIFAVMGIFCGCGPSESDILTSKTKNNIVEHYSEPGQTAVFVKAHSFLQYSDTSFMIEAVISKNGKKYLTPPLYIEIVDGKALITYPDSGISNDPSSFLREL